MPPRHVVPPFSDAVGSGRALWPVSPQLVTIAAPNTPYVATLRVFPVGLPLPSSGRTAGWEAGAAIPSVNGMTTTTPPLAPGRLSRTFRQLGIDTQYVLLGFPLG